MIPFSYNLRSIMVRKRSTFATAAGIGLVSFVFSAVIMMASGLLQTLGGAARPDVAIILRLGADGEKESNIENRAVAAIMAEPGVARDSRGRPDAVNELARVITLTRAGMAQRCRENPVGCRTIILIRGVNDNVFAFRPTVKIIDGRAYRPGTNEAIIGRQLWRKYEGAQVGGTIGLPSNTNVKVVGVFEDGGSSYESEVWCDLDHSRRAFRRPEDSSSVRVRLSSPSKFDTFAATVESYHGIGLDAMTEVEFYERQSSGLGLIFKVLTVITGVLLSFGAIIGAMITMYASVSSRIRELGVLRAIGFTRSSTLISLLLEMLLLSMAGGVIGVLASLPLTLIQLQTWNSSSYTSVLFSFSPSAGTLAVSIALSGLMGLIGGLMPAIRASQVSPVEAMRG